MKDSVPPMEKPCNTANPDVADRFERLALEELRRHGFRITMTRIQVIRALAESNRALSAYQVHERIAATGGRIDVVSVYRILATLQEVGLVHRIGVVDGYYACRSAGEHDHRSEHLVCQECGCVIEVEVPKPSVDAVLADAKRFGFKLTDIKIEATGICEHCLGGSKG